MIELRNIRRTLRGGGVPLAFTLPSLSIGAGERWALTGPSGCGKSTMLNVVAGLLRPDSGNVRVLGKELTALSAPALDAFRGAHYGFVFQNFNLLEPFTAEENVLIGMRFGRKIPHVERTARARQLLDRVGLGARAGHRPSRLSNGERQRVAIARALANRPEVLLADEPTGALDPATAEEVFALLLEVLEAERCTLLLVTHDLELAARLPKQLDCRGLVGASA